MPRRLPPYVERNCVKGHTYLSFRRGRGARVRLPDDPTSNEFRVAYQAALSGQIAPARERSVRATPGSIGALIASYLRNSNYIGLRETTKKGYATRIEVLREQHGHRSVSGLTRERIEKVILAPYSDRPGARLSVLKMLRILIAHARTLDRGNPCRLDHDASAGIERPKTKEIRAWSDTECAAFERRWPVGSKQRTAYSLMLYVGTARVDVHRMTWAQFDNLRVEYKRNKTGVGVVMGVHTELQLVLAAADRSHVTIVNTEYGRPFTVGGFSQFMRDAIRAAGLPLDCKPHGLRKTLGRRMADAGCTAHEIMAALGHTTLGEAERYTREADRRRDRIVRESFIIRPAS
jgi:integrase